VGLYSFQHYGESQLLGFRRGSNRGRETASSKARQFCDRSSPLAPSFYCILQVMKKIFWIGLVVVVLFGYLMYVWMRSNGWTIF
jgi:hypothetical protein